MRLPPGSDPEKATFGYMTALQGFSLDAIEQGIQRFLRGECKDVSPKFCPYPPELANIIRTTVVQQRIPQRNQIAPHREPLPGEKARMRLKMPMWQACHWNKERLDALAKANAEGFAAMVTLATVWGVPVPQELFDIPDEEAERQWRHARNRALDEIERNPPPYMRNRKSA